MLEVGQGAPEHELSELRVAHLVGVGEVVARGRRETEGGDGSHLESQPVTDIIETQSMSELDKEHGAEVAEHGVGPGFDIDVSLLGCPLDDVTRNELEHLPENIDVVTCWLHGVSECVCVCVDFDIALQIKPLLALSQHPSPQISMGRL